MYHPQRASPPQNQSSPISAFNLDDDNLKPLWASASQPSQYTEGPSELVEDESPVKEVAPVKTKRKYTRRRQPLKKSNKEFVKPWTIEEEVALCKAWVSTSEDSIEGNGKKASGFWTEVTKYFQKEMVEHKRSYDLVNCKWKNRIRPKILKDHSKWNKVEMPKFYTFKKSSSKKSRTSETTSQGNSDSEHIGLNLNDETDLEDVDVQERKESSSVYLRIKECELKLEDQKHQEQGELERLKTAQQDKELDL
nr:hypothetical protein [Tanacetum cinerariifolium]